MEKRKRENLKKNKKKLFEKLQYLKWRQKENWKKINEKKTTHNYYVNVLSHLVITPPTHTPEHTAL